MEPENFKGHSNDPEQEKLREEFEWISKEHRGNVSAWKALGKDLEGDDLSAKERLDIHSLRFVGLFVNMMTNLWLKRVGYKINEYGAKLSREVIPLEKDVNQKCLDYEQALKSGSADKEMRLQELQESQMKLGEFCQSKLLYVLDEREDPEDRDERLIRELERRWQLSDLSDE